MHTSRIVDRGVFTVKVFDGKRSGILSRVCDVEREELILVKQNYAELCSS